MRRAGSATFIMDDKTRLTYSAIQRIEIAVQAILPATYARSLPLFHDEALVTLVTLADIWA